MKEINYNGENRPILHRKETFVGKDYPLYADFKSQTEREEEQGLLKEGNMIGFEKGWEKELRKFNE